MKKKTVLTIAGSDNSGGAGMQADPKTMTMNGVYAMSANTSPTAQNTTGVRAIQESAPEFLARQIDAVFEDIYPDAVKIGRVSSDALAAMLELGKGFRPMDHAFCLISRFAKEAE